MSVLLRPPVLRLPASVDSDLPGPRGDWDDRCEPVVRTGLPPCSVLLVALLTTGGTVFACYL